MGKSPGKWIKSILGKKSSKSSSSTGKASTKSINNGDAVSSKALMSNFESDPSPILPIRVGIGTHSPKDRHVRGQQISGSLQEDCEKNTKQEHLVMKVQATTRGFPACHEFETLEGIIMLQALIRGRLVRRQAAATLGCIWSIVKFQALARGRKARHASIGIELQKKYNLGKFQGVKCYESHAIQTSALMEKLTANVFAQQLLSSTSNVEPLRLKYGPEELNSASKWLDRWSRSQFWSPSTKSTSSLTKGDGSQILETEEGREKHSLQQVPSAAEFNRTEQYLREPSSFSFDLVEEHPLNELEKVKLKLRKISESTNFGRETKTAVGNDPSDKMMKDIVPEVPMNVVNDNIDFGKSKVDSAINEGQEWDTKPDDKSDEISNNSNHEISQRCASFPSMNVVTDVCSASKVPSYMAPTKSAMAKLRSLGSPTFPQGEEKNSVNTTNGKLTSMSPRGVQQSVHVGGKVGAKRNEQCFSVSRDGFGSGKFVKPEWRR